MNKIKKYDNLLLFVGIAIFAAIVTFATRIDTGDELWNFQNLYKMVNGYKIYTDANVIITPIFYWIGSALLKLFGANYFIYKMYNVLIYSCMILVVYNIFKQLNIDKNKSLLYTLIINILIYIFILQGANYNILAILFVLLGIYISLRKFGRNKFNILNGIIIFLILFTKQNIGVYYCISTVIMQIILNGRNKKTYIDITKQAIISIILCTISLFVFKIQGNLYDFINYAFLGIGEFAKKNLHLESQFFIFLIIDIFIITIAFILMNKVKKEEKNNIIILLCIGIGMLPFVYPIINMYHILVSIFILSILLIYMTHLAIKEIINPKVVKIGVSIFIVITILYCIQPIIYCFKNNKLYVREYENPYFGAILMQETKDNIENINSYIKNKHEKVIVLSGHSALYNIPQKRNNGMMDLPFLGNLGYGGEDDLIIDLDNKKGYEVLITESAHSQESEKVIDYIKENYEYIGEIEQFQIYKIK